LIQAAELLLVHPKTPQIIHELMRCGFHLDTEALHHGGQNTMADYHHRT
jgi:hypothetical protein